MSALTVMQPVNADDLAEYPIDPDARLDSHGFLQWEFGRWLASDLRWNGSHESKSMAFDLFNLAYRETPVGTLPFDIKRLSQMVQPVVDRDYFARLCDLPFGPLHGWIKCRCGDDVRLMHPVLTRKVLEALASRANHAARVEASSHARRLKRLTEEVGQLSADMAADSRKVRFIDTVIQERVEGRGGSRRTAEDLHFAVQECIAKARAGGFPTIA